MPSRLVLGGLLTVALFVAGTCSGAVASGADRAADELLGSFVAGYRKLQVPDFGMSYQDNFAKIQDPAGLARQLEFFTRFDQALGRLDRRTLGDEVRYQVDAVRYEVRFNLARLALEKRFKERPAAEPLPSDGLYRLPDGRQWYLLYARRWAACDVTPEQLLALGSEEVSRVTSEVVALQGELGFAGRDLAAQTIADEDVLRARLVALRAKVQRSLPRCFLSTDVPLVGLSPIENPTKDTPPGYWDAGVFHYAFYQHAFPRRSLTWLYLHEAVPGHHYQKFVSAKRSPVQELFWYPGYSEGWGAYAEDLGQELGCYADRYQLLGKWEWDLVRSARVVLDVGLHYQGWTRQQALTYWREHVPGQEGIAEREISRVIRWPAQVLSYKVGERRLLDLRARCQERAGAAFDLRRFHATVLRRGSVPLPVLEEEVLDALDRGELSGNVGARGTPR